MVLKIFDKVFISSPYRMDSQPPFGDRNYVQQYFDTRVAYRPVQLYGYGSVPWELLSFDDLIV